MSSPPAAVDAERLPSADVEDDVTDPAPVARPPAGRATSRSEEPRTPPTFLPGYYLG